MILNSKLIVKKSELHDFDRIAKLLTLANPEYENKKKHAYSKSALVGVAESICFIEEYGDKVYLPRNFPVAGLRVTADERVDGRPTNGYSFEGLLRAYQKPYIDDLIRSSVGDFVMQVPCGHGKSVMMLYMLAKWGRKALILVPRNTLAKQWMEYAELFTPKARVKKFTTKDNVDTYKTDNTDIVIMTMELFKLRTFPEKFYDQFGIVVMDEAHRVGAPTYHPIIDKLPAKRRVALSATFRRKDGMQDILRYHFGESVVMDNKFPKAQLLPLKTGIKASGSARMTKKNKKTGEEEEYFSPIYVAGRMSFTALDTYMVQKNFRNLALFSVMLKLIRDKGRTVLCLSKRRTILELFHKMMIEKGIRSYLIVGGSGDIPEEEKQNAKFFAGIAQLAEEGIDIENADTLMLMHPISDIEQAAGRIRRIKEGKKEPLIIWPYDEVGPYQKMYAKQLDFRDVVEPKKSIEIITFIKSLK